MPSGTFNKIGAGSTADPVGPDFSSLGLPSTQVARFVRLISDTPTTITCDYKVFNLVDPKDFSVDIDTRVLKTTTNATPVTITYTPPTNSAARLTATVTATNGTLIKVWTLWVQAKRGSGNAILVGTVQNPVAPQGDTGTSAWTAAVTVSGANIVLTLTGAAATNISWLSEIAGRVFNP